MEVKLTNLRASFGQKTRPSQKPQARLMARIGILMTIAYTSTAYAAIVFSDDFSEPSSTVIDGKAPDVGNAWNEVTSTNITVGVSNTLDTTGAARYLEAAFTDTLGAGETLTISFDAGLKSSNGFGVVTLRSAFGGAELFNLGTTWANGRGVGGAGGASFVGNVDATSTLIPITFTYEYDTGAWTYSGPNGSGSGAGTTGLALATLDVRNGSGGDIIVDNLTVNIVPEPATAFLGGVGMLALLRRRRR